MSYCMFGLRGWVEDEGAVWNEVLYAWGGWVGGWEERRTKLSHAREAVLVTVFARVSWPGRVGGWVGD